VLKFETTVVKMIPFEGLLGQEHSPGDVGVRQALGDEFQVPAHLTGAPGPSYRGRMDAT
jgi:hypothetical protein